MSLYEVRRVGYPTVPQCLFDYLRLLEDPKTQGTRRSASTCTT